jgi:hypothetical protein
MNISLSQFGPYIWLVAAILVVIVVFVIVRFFWQHVLKYLLRGCLVIVGILILLEVLHYLKVF